jgi:hypothetical protein
MKVGMLWFDNDPKKALAEKVLEAAAYFRRKYGQVPNTCLVNPAMLTDESVAGAVAVRPWRTVTPGHLWIGVEDKDE